jgi:hypothetical protein
MKRSVLFFSLLLLSFTALAAGPNEVRKQAQASMLVTGSIEITPDGKIKSYAIDQQDKLPAPVVGLLQKSLSTWEFKPVVVDGTAVEAKAKMSLRVVAKPLDDQHDSIGIEGAYFGDNAEIPGKMVSRSKTREQPKYPELEVRSRVTGTVYALLKIGRDGTVADAAVEQVNLGVYASDHDMNLFRRDLGKATLNALRHWTFSAPANAEHAADAYWYARVPVNFNISKNGAPPARAAYGQWESYIPGPREIIPWAEKSQLISASPDAAPAGGVYQMDQGLQLKTPLAGV